MKKNLPMVCPPKDWRVKDGVRLKDGEIPRIFDLVGGYLSQPGGDFMNRYRLLTSHEYDHFFVKLSSVSAFSEMCRSINALKKKPSTAIY
jgi:hypothetical protein